LQWHSNAIRDFNFVAAGPSKMSFCGKDFVSRLPCRWQRWLCFAVPEDERHFGLSSASAAIIPATFVFSFLFLFKISQFVLIIS
jgi:hypothetical protein